MTAIQHSEGQHPEAQRRRARLLGAAIAVGLIGVGVTGLNGPSVSAEPPGPADLVRAIASGHLAR
jgi:hypothetical protein